MPRAHDNGTRLAAAHMQGFRRAASAETNARYDQAARDLFAQLGLAADGSTTTGSAPMRGMYDPLNQIWGDKQTGGKIFVGNQQAAQNAAMLKAHGITCVVNCTDSMPLYHQNTFQYYRFNVTFWSAHGDTTEKLSQFLQPMLDFVDACVARGEGVLVHCLAGAHRAGTTGCMLLMYKAGLSAANAVAAAKQLRPVIDPIGRFPELLRKFESLQKSPAKLVTRITAQGTAAAEASTATNS